MPRINEITLIVGRRGTGKTTAQRKILMENRKKSLVVDTFPHPSWSDHPIVEIDKLKYWKAGNYRIILGSNESDFETDLVKIGQYANNCNIVFEDARKYFSHSVPKQVERIIIDSKQKNVDVYIMYHSLSQVPKYLREMYDNLILFKTGDAPDVYRRFSNYAEIEAVHSRVMAHQSNYYCEVIKE